MTLSYGELSAISSAWDDYKHDNGLTGTAGDAWDFIDSINDVYPDDADKDEIFSYIGCIEEC